MSERLLDYAEVGRRLGLGRTQLWAMVKRGEFPAPLRIGRARRWQESTVDDWIRALAARSDAAGADAGAPA